MARLHKCPLCSNQRYALFARFGKIYSKHGNRVLKSTNYNMCSTCNNIFLKNKLVNRFFLKDDITNKIESYISDMINSEIDKGDFDPQIVTILSNVKKDIKNIVISEFNNARMCIDDPVKEVAK